MEAALWKRIKEAYAEAIDLPPADQEAYVTECDPAIREEVARLLAANRKADNFIDIPFLVEHDSLQADPETTLEGTTIDDYLLLEILGSGGMGTVYLAEHSGEGFSHRVALKLIKRGMDTGVVLRRFLTERQILASLDHPNIARLIGGGSTLDDRPYFVMEYVDGSPLREYCDSRSLDTRSRVEIFAKVCEAVSYAHQKLVVHRDLKPSNILIDEKGEPKLLDFGIAKLLTPEWQTSTDTVTVTQFRILTPEYSSPEQLRGDVTTTLTDVYSLGVVLYELLTGVRPFEREAKHPGTLAEAIRSKEPAKPSFAALYTFSDPVIEAKVTNAEIVEKTGRSVVDPNTRRSVPDPLSLRGDIDNIVLKAIRSEPEYRYQSVGEFLEDIERYLKGLPVKATKDSLSYRASKFVRRHRAGVALAAASAVVLASALGISLYQYTVARSERQRAEARFNEVRRFAHSIIFDHYERIKDIPGATEAKARLIAEAVTYLDGVSADSGEDPEFLRELVQAYKKLAEIQGMTAGTADLGDLASSRRNYTRALEIQERLVDLDPKNIADKRQLASLLSNYGYVGNLDNQERAQYAFRSFEIVKTLRAVNADKEQAESDYARGLWDRAHAVRKLGDNAGAIAGFIEAAEIYERLYADGAGNKKYRRSAALTYKNLGTVQRLSGDVSGGLASYQKALKFDTQINSETPENLESRLGLSFSHRGMGEALTAVGRHAEAVRSFDQAVKIQEAVRASDPSNAFAGDNLFDSYVGMAIAFREMKDFNQAETYFRKAFELEAAAKRDKTDYLRLQAIATARLEFAQMLNSRNLSEAKDGVKTELEKALATFEEARAANALDPAYMADYERAKSLLGSI